RRMMISFPGAGHFLPIEAPDAAEDIAWFLDTGDGKPARPPVGMVEDCAQ
ncbi:MAG: alpha/beta hydrolase, partial [Sphingopyxis sp.]|nr:alpha/beta hydrolase [Sphingopyxis sp.]